MDIEIVLKRADRPLPSLGIGGLRYVVAENGIFLERRTELYSTTCRVDRCVAGLDDHREGCRLDAPSLPPNALEEMVGFFRWAFERHGGEAALILLYDPEKRVFSWHCPWQRVELWESWSGKWYASSRIEYTDPHVLPPGHVVFGDAHSHADQPAYASGVDRDDELFKDGLHIIAGRVHRDEPEFHVDFVMDGQRFSVDPDVVLPETSCPSADAVPDEWKRKVLVDYRPYRDSGWRRSKERKRRRR